LIGVAREGLVPSGPTVRVCSSPGLQPVRALPRPNHQGRPPLPPNSRELQPARALPRLNHPGRPPLPPNSRGLQPARALPRLNHPDNPPALCNSRGLQPVRALPRLNHQGRPPLPPNSRGLQPALDVREFKDNRVPRRSAALAQAAKHGSRAIEAMKVCQVGEPADLHPAVSKPLPAVEGPALRAAADLASKR